MPTLAVPLYEGDGHFVWRQEPSWLLIVNAHLSVVVASYLPPLLSKKQVQRVAFAKKAIVCNSIFKASCSFASANFVCKVATAFGNWQRGMEKFTAIIKKAYIVISLLPYI